MTARRGSVGVLEMHTTAAPTDGLDRRTIVIASTVTLGVIRKVSIIPAAPRSASRCRHTQRTIDREVHRLVDEAHRDVTRLLTEHRSQLHARAEALLQAERLDAGDAYAATGVSARPPDDEARAAA
jgi:hypothetical protein